MREKKDNTLHQFEDKTSYYGIYIESQIDQKL